MIIDLRSDAYSIPPPEMRRAMSEFEFDSEALDEDSMVRNLQELAAIKFGKECGLFVPSGTMGNLVSVLSHCPERGGEIYVGEETHMYNLEQGGVAQLGGVFVKGVRTLSDGALDLENLKSKFRFGNNVHHGRGRLIVLENTTQGKVLGPEYFAKIRDYANAVGVKVHLDGARIANAVSALKCDVKEIMKYVDSAMVSLSKGLCAPIGSIIVGNKEFITAARRIRQVLGGEMYTGAGILAVAGITALNVMWERVHQDHAHALRFAKEVSIYDKIFKIDLNTIETNMVLWEIKASSGINASYFIAKMREATKSNPSQVSMTLVKSGTVIRAVFHRTITSELVDQAINKLKDVCNSIFSNLKIN